MPFTHVCTVSRGLRMLSDILNVLPNVCFLTLRRCCSVALHRSSIAPHRTCIRSSRTLRPTVCLSSAHNLPTARRAVHSDAVTDSGSPTDHGDVSANQPEDLDCLYSEGSSLHTPVLAKEVVDLISPTKGQVCLCHCCKYCWPTIKNFNHDLILHYITLHAEIYSARSYEEKIDRACIT